MFEQTFVQSTGQVRKRWPVVLSFFAQVVGVAVIVMIPILQTTPLHWTPAMVVYAPPREAPKMRVVEAHGAPQQSSPSLLRAVFRPRLVGPTSIPKQISLAPDDGPPVSGIGPAYDPGSSVLSELGSSMTTAVAPSVVKPAAVPKPTALRVSGGVQEALLIHQVKPVYPSLARTARISGVVRLAAVIAKDGTIQNLRVVSGHPLLTKAALDAVQQWRYKPTFLGDQAVEVITDIEVHFTLAN